MSTSLECPALPIEMWLHILAFTCQFSLSSLCLTCSQLLLLARPIMYTELVLRAENQTSPNGSVTATFSLLARNEELARSVRKLTLNSHSSRLDAYYRNPGLLNAPSLRNMTRLKSVTIHGDISRHASAREVVEFVQILHDLQLDELRFPAPGSRPFLTRLGRPQLMLLGNVKLVECYMGVDHNDLVARQLLVLLPAATASLTTLSLTAQHLYTGDWAMHPLFDLHFPFLRSLALESTADREIACPRKFNAFLSAHHKTLEELWLGYTRNMAARAFSPAALVFDDRTGLNPGFLPNLRVFGGHCRNVEMMALARMRCLSTLEQLTIGSAKNEPETTIADLRRMFNALDATGRLDSLRYLDFDLFRWQEPESKFIAPFMHRFGALCGPTLEVWSGLLPYLGEWHPDVFAEFPRLRVIRLSSNSPLALAGDVLRRGFLTFLALNISELAVTMLARTCPVLEEVQLVNLQILVNLQNVKTVSSTWKIDRHPILGTALRIRPLSGINRHYI